MVEALDGAAQHAQAARAFDAVAGTYDRTYGKDGNPAMAWMRAESVALLAGVFPKSSSLLELGCGTGAEALELAQCGHRVLATDVSPAMAAIAAQKAKAAGVSDRVRVVALASGSLTALRPRAPFDGAYASFGGLNCEPELDGVAEGLGRLVRSGGAFVCGVMNRTYLFELAWYLLRGKLRQASRRLRGGWVPAPVAGPASGEVSVLTRYLGLRELQQVFHCWFEVERVLALPLLMPPPYAATLYERRGGLVRWLERWERTLRSRMPLSLLGDHLLIVFRRI